MKARTVVGRGEKGPLCDPGSELRTTGREHESIESATIVNGMQKKTKKQATCTRSLKTASSHSAILYIGQTDLRKTRDLSISLTRDLSSLEDTDNEMGSDTYTGMCVIF